MISAKRQARLILIISLIGISGSISTAVVDLGAFLQLNAWQMLPNLAAAAVSMMIWLVIIGLVNKKKLGAAGLLVPINIIIVFAFYEALISQSFLESMLAGGTLILVAGIFTINKRWWIAASLTGLYALITGYIYQFHPFTRFDTTRVTGMGNYFFILAGVIIFTILIDAIFSSSFFTRSIRNRLLVTFSVIVLVSTVIVTVMSLAIQQRKAQQDAYNQLSMVATLKQAEITRWIGSVNEAYSAILSNQSLLDDISYVLIHSPQITPSNQLSPEQKRLQDQFNSIKQKATLFDDFYLVSSDGNIPYALNTSQSNIERIQAEWKNTNIAQSGTFTTPVSVYETPDHQLQKTILAGKAIMGEGNAVIGYVIGRLNFILLQQILAEKTGLGATVETYLVDAQQNMLTPSLLYSDWQNVSKINTQGVISALTKQQGSESYINYHGTPVYGVYQHIPELGVILMAEQNSAEALVGTQSVYLPNIISAVIALFIAFLSSTFLASNIVSPINELVKVSTRVASGDLMVKAEVGRQDETGVLAKTFNTMTDQLYSLVQNLEKRVSDRTSELQRRALQVRLAGEIARDIAGIEKLDEILNRSVSLVHDRFGFYHAGIFLVDERHEYAVLRAATGEAGRRMLERDHKLRIGETGIVGYVVGQGAPRIALNVDDDPTYYRNPLLPDTLSEMALPLKIGSQVIGALDVQSKLQSAFNQEDIDVLQTMADQVAIAIEKARILEQLQLKLRELELMNRQRTGQSWRNYLVQSHKKYGFRYHHHSLEKLEDTSLPTATSFTQLQPVVSISKNGKDNGHGEKGSLVIPIHIRGQVIGSIKLEFGTAVIDPRMVTLVENIANRLALALENARLMEERQLRAEREHNVSAISSKVRSSSDIDSILKTVVQELSQVLGVTGAVVKLSDEASHKEAA
jgi:GAF domain-containing protein/HAMP domain-containing protein